MTGKELKNDEPHPTLDRAAISVTPSFLPNALGPFDRAQAQRLLASRYDEGGRGPSLEGVSKVVDKGPGLEGRDPSSIEIGKGDGASLLSSASDGHPKNNDVSVANQKAQEIKSCEQKLDSTTHQGGAKSFFKVFKKVTSLPSNLWRKLTGKREKVANDCKQSSNKANADSPPRSVLPETSDPPSKEMQPSQPTSKEAPGVITPKSTGGQLNSDESSKMVEPPKTSTELPITDQTKIPVSKPPTTSPLPKDPVKRPGEQPLFEKLLPPLTVAMVAMALWPRDNSGGAEVQIGNKNTPAMPNGITPTNLGMSLQNLIFELNPDAYRLDSGFGLNGGPLGRIMGAVPIRDRKMKGNSSINGLLFSDPLGEGSAAYGGIVWQKGDRRAGNKSNITSRMAAGLLATRSPNGETRLLPSGGLSAELQKNYPSISTRWYSDASIANLPAMREGRLTAGMGRLDVSSEVSKSFGVRGFIKVGGSAQASKNFGSGVKYVKGEAGLTPPVLLSTGAVPWHVAFPITVGFARRCDTKNMGVLDECQNRIEITSTADIARGRHGFITFADFSIRPTGQESKMSAALAVGYRYTLPSVADSDSRRWLQNIFIQYSVGTIVNKPPMGFMPPFNPAMLNGGANSGVLTFGVNMWKRP